MLTDRQRHLWDDYEAAEARAPRSLKLQALAVFLDSLESSPPAEWYPWARWIAEQVVDQSRDFKIRRPLFTRAVFPALLAGHQSGLTGCARWLAGLAHHLRSNPECRNKLPAEEATELGLLWAAIQVDPGDRRSRLRWIDRVAGGLRYAIHEVPAGVLYGSDGASPEQCQALEDELEQFGRLTAEEGIQDQYATLIRSCRFHFRGYQHFLLHREQYQSYSPYVAQYANAGME